MLLGKRSRHPIKRTTSMTGITVDVSNLEDVQEQPIISDPPPAQYPQNHPNLHDFPNSNFSNYDQRFLAMVSPRNPGRSANVLDGTAPFLRSCCLCKRRLAPGRDIYMYRGDTAFCSLECREQQMKQDEGKEKSNVINNNAPNKEDNNNNNHRHGHGHASNSATSSCNPSSKTHPLAAA